MQNKKYFFHVHGMHCPSCVLYIDSEISEHENVFSVKADLSKSTVEIDGDFGDLSDVEIARNLSKIISAHGYSLSVEKINSTKKFSDFKFAIPVALFFVFLFVLLQKAGIVNIVDTKSVSLGTVFFIGVVASLSTCMAVVGGLLLSMSASFAKEGTGYIPHILFHVGRFMAFFVLGGFIGSLGSVFTIGQFTMSLLGFVIGIVMLILGINLLDIFHFSKKAQFTTPKFISKHAISISKWNHSLTPFVVGMATFFLPCGFTQSMQIYTLSAGSFFTGGITMFVFALGTFPALALISFGAGSFQRSKHAGKFFKTAGIIVILFALLNILNSLVVAGIINPIFSF